MSGSGRALLFDIDGTLADTDALHLKAFNQVFAPHGHVFDRDRASKELMGFSNASISERFLPGNRRSARRPSWREGTKLPQARFGANQAVGGSDGTACPGGSRRHPHGGGDQRAAPERRNVALRARHHASVQGSHHRRRASARQAAPAAVSGRFARGGRRARPVSRIRGFPLRRSIRFGRRHRDDWNTDEPWPWRSGRGRRGQHGRDL